MPEDPTVETGRPAGLPLRLLLVDDDVNLGESLGDALEERGFEVVVVTEGEAALGLLAREHFDAALVDIRMPGLDGAATARLIHSLTPGLPVIMMTGYELDELARQALAEGAVAVLRKPLDIEQAVSLIERTVKRPTVLVVDPDSRQALRLVQVLTSANCLTAAVTDLPAAREALRRGSYDCIILDSGIVREHGPDSLLDIARLQPRAYLVFVRSAAGGPPVGEEARRTLEAQVRHAAFAVLDKHPEVREVLRVVQRIRYILKERTGE